MPSELVPPKSSAAEIRRMCSEAIRASHFVAVDIDSYGLDCAWEMGYAEALNVRVIGVSPDFAAVDEPRVVNKRKYFENETHGWEQLFFSSDLEALAARCKGKIVHVCCPFENEAPMLALQDSIVNKEAARLIFPKDELDIGDREPRDYSWRTRNDAVGLLKEADVVLAVLPRYGMDTAWKLGCAAALEKETIGWLTSDMEEPIAEAQILDHWMHPWKHDGWITGLINLAALVNGLAGCGRISFSQ
jgi:nucleoside 2-deoxyribosyltransferase